MTQQHKILVNSATRISGTPYDFTVNIQVPNLQDVNKLKTVKLESTSIVSGTLPANLYVATTSLSFPYSYDTNRQNEMAVVGQIPYKVQNGTAYLLYATTQDNSPIASSNIESVLKSNILNFRIVDATGALVTTFSSDITLVVVFSE